MTATIKNLVIGKIRLALLVGGLGLAGLFAPRAHAQTQTQVPAPRAKVVSVKMLHNEFRNGQKGMVINIAAEVDGLRNAPVRFAAYMGQRNGGLLKGMPGPYCSPNGEVTCQTVVYPQYHNTDLKNIELFIPLTELNIQQVGRHDLRFFIEVTDTLTGRPFLLTATGNYYFNYTLQPPATPAPTPTPAPSPNQDLVYRQR